jgi:hypothetical protein
MDILNFISWIRGGRVVTTVNPAQTLLPVGLKDSRRDDGYLAGAISVEDLVTQLTPTPTYKVFTALLTQSGGDDPQTIDSGSLIIGATYQNNGNLGDFTNVGAPNNNDGTYWIATGTTPNNWGEGVYYNTGAPVATVLENTIGNIWFTYVGVGNYFLNSNGLFIENKTWTYPNNTQSIPTDGGSFITLYLNSINSIILESSNDDIISYGGNPLRLEIRVYN